VFSLKTEHREKKSLIIESYFNAIGFVNHRLASHCAQPRESTEQSNLQIFCPWLARTPTTDRKIPFRSKGNILLQKTIKKVSIFVSKINSMQTLLLQGNSKKEIELFFELAKKIGLKASLLSDDDMEDAGLLNAMKKGRTGKYVNTSNYLKKLKGLDS
jgi:hypothetical protein